MIYDKYLCNICVMMSLVFYLLGTSRYKPIITSCSVKSTRYQHTVTLDWELLNEFDMASIREYWIYCSCTNYKTNITNLDKVCIYMHKLFLLFIKTYIGVLATKKSQMCKLVSHLLNLQFVFFSSEFPNPFLQNWTTLSNKPTKCN